MSCSGLWFRWCVCAACTLCVRSLNAWLFGCFCGLPWRRTSLLSLQLLLPRLQLHFCRDKFCHLGRRFELANFYLLFNCLSPSVDSIWVRIMIWKINKEDSWNAYCQPRMPIFTHINGSCMGRVFSGIYVFVGLSVCCFTTRYLTNWYSKDHETWHRHGPPWVLETHLF